MQVTRMMDKASAATAAGVQQAKPCCALPTSAGKRSAHRQQVVAQALPGSQPAARTQHPAPPQAAAVAAPPAKNPANLNDRQTAITQHFPQALPVDDYISRIEIALSGYGFTGDNTIAMSNLCRDESCMVLEDKIESVFGSCFATHGLGGVLTCGVIGIKAGLSHSPVCGGGKERYVFFSFPHIGIDSNASVGKISRPNRAGASTACGALAASLGEFKANGLEASTMSPGVHDPTDPEYSILKQRLARRLQHEGCDVAKLDLVSVTKAAERTITSDLEFLIEKAVDTSKADYAVFTGVQIHNWAADLQDKSTPSLEFVSVGKSYVVVNGEKTFLDLNMVPSLAPRQLRLLAAQSVSQDDGSSTERAQNSIIQKIPREYLMRRLGGASGARSALAKSKSSDPSWSNYIKTTYTDSHPSAPRMDS